MLAAPFLLSAAAAAKFRKVPVGLELYSLRDQMKTDLMGVIDQVGRMGYQGVEFYSPYADWTTDYAKQVRARLDAAGLRCFSTHNSPKSFAPENLTRTAELNQILGSKQIVMASAGRVTTLDGWKGVAATLTKAAEQWKPMKMRAGFHNHQTEFTPLEGTRPIEILAKETPKDVVLQLDLGTCVHAGSDPVAWIRQNPGRFGSLHLKDWSKDPEVGYHAPFGEGNVPWKEVFTAAEKVGGVEFYLIEQEGSKTIQPMDMVVKCLENFRKVRS
jgi:sugar phosphate isomerase/epimerase